MLAQGLEGKSWFPQFTPLQGWNLGEDAWNKASLHVLFIFPSEMGVRSVSATHCALYAICKEALGQDVFVDIWMEPYKYNRSNYEKGVPNYVTGFFSHHTWHDFDIVGFSLAITMTEFVESTVVMKKAGIPLWSKERLANDKMPLIVLGGCATDNSAILDNVVDIYMLGAGERTLPHLLKTALKYQAQYGTVGKAKEAIISDVQTHRGFYNPKLYKYTHSVVNGHWESVYEGCSIPGLEIVRPDTEIPAELIRVSDYQRKLSTPGGHHKVSLQSSFGAVPGDTWIETPTGRKPISELVGSSGKVLVHGQFETYKAVVSQGVRDTVRVKLSDGNEFRVSSDHKFLIDGLTEAKQVEASSLVSGTVLYKRIKSAAISFGEYQRTSTGLLIDEQMAEFLGFFAGDGCAHYDSRISKSTGKPYGWNIQSTVRCDGYESVQYMPAFKRLTGKEGFRVRGTEFTDGVKIGDFYAQSPDYDSLVNELHLYGDVYAKSVSDLIFKSPRSVILAYIQGYLQADGCAHINGKHDRLHITASSVSHKLIEKVSQLLNILGYRTHITHMPAYVQRGKTYNESWHLQVSIQDCISLFDELKHVGKFAFKLTEHQRRNFHAYKKLALDDFGYQRVTVLSVVEDEPCECFDIVDTESHLADYGLYLTHQCMGSGSCNFCHESWLYGCFTGDTLVTTEHGLVPISKIEVGDRVLTGKGNFKRVLHVHRNGMKDFITVRCMGEEIHTTANHAWFTRTSSETEPTFKPIGKSLNCQVYRPRYKFGDKHLNSGLAFLIGLYLSDGTYYHVSLSDGTIKHWGLRVSGMASHEAVYRQKFESLGLELKRVGRVNRSNRDSSNEVEYFFTDELSESVLQYVTPTEGNIQKDISDDVYLWDEESVLHLLQGFFWGDGAIKIEKDASSSKVQFLNTNRLLVEKLATLSSGLYASVFTFHQKEFSGKKAMYSVRLNAEDSCAFLQTFPEVLSIKNNKALGRRSLGLSSLGRGTGSDEFGYYVSLRKKNCTAWGQAEAFDLEVEDDSSYCVGTKRFIVHNSWRERSSEDLHRGVQLAKKSGMGEGFSWFSFNCFADDTVFSDGERPLYAKSITDKVVTPSGVSSCTVKKSVDKVYKVRYSNGVTLELTGKHRNIVLTEGALKECHTADLKPGMKVPSLVYSVWNNAFVMDNKAYLKGLYFGDGSSYNNGIVFCGGKHEPEIYNQLLNILGSLGEDFRGEDKGTYWKVYVKASDLTEEIKKDTSFVHNKYWHKLEDLDVERFSFSEWASFLRGWFDADSGINNGTFSLIHKNYLPLLRAHSVLTYFGIHSSIIERKPRLIRFPNGTEGVFSCYELHIQGKSSIKNFCHKIGLTVTRKLNKLLAKGHSLTGRDYESIPYEVCEQGVQSYLEDWRVKGKSSIEYHNELGYSAWNHTNQSCSFLDAKFEQYPDMLDFYKQNPDFEILYKGRAHIVEVISVEEVNDRPVVDILETNNGLLIANGILQHNCNFIQNYVDDNIFAAEYFNKIGSINLRIDSLAGSIKMNGENNYIRLLKELGTSSIACLHGSTLIETKRGLVPIRDVKVGDEVVSLKFEYKRGLRQNPEATWNKVTHVLPRGVKKLYKFTTHDNHSFIATLDHVLPTCDCQRIGGIRDVEAQHLIGKRVLVRENIMPNSADNSLHYSGKLSSRCKYQRPTEITPGLALLLGWLMGDGYVSGKGSRFYFGEKDNEAYSKIIQILNYEGIPYSEEETPGAFGVVKRINVNSQGFTDFVQACGLEGSSVYKTFPARIYTASTYCQLAFLSGYFSADGRCRIKNHCGHKSVCISVTSISSSIVTGVSTLLSSLGMKNRIESKAGNTETNSGFAHSHPTSTINLKGNDSFKSLLQNVSFLQSYKTVSAEELGSKRTVYCDTLEKVEFYSEEECWDLTIDGEPYFTANGIYVHNCPIEGISQRMRNFYNKNLTEDEVLTVDKEVFKRRMIRLKHGVVWSAYETKEDYQEHEELYRKIIDLRDMQGANTQLQANATWLVHNAGTPLYYKPRRTTAMAWKQFFAKYNNEDFYFYPWMYLSDLGVKLKESSQPKDTIIQQNLQDCPTEFLEEVWLKPISEGKFENLSNDMVVALKDGFEKYGVNPKSQFLEFNAGKNPRQHLKIGVADEVCKKLDNGDWNHYFQRCIDSNGGTGSCLRTPATEYKHTFVKCIGCSSCKDIDKVRKECGLEVQEPHIKWMKDRPLNIKYNLMDMKTALMANSPSFYYRAVFQIKEAGRFIAKESLVRKWLSKATDFDESLVKNFRTISYAFHKSMDYEGLISQYTGYELCQLGFKDPLDLQKFQEVIDKTNELPECREVIKLLKFDAAQESGGNNFRILETVDIKESAEDMKKFLSHFEEEHRLYEGGTSMPETFAMDFKYKVIPANGAYRVIYLKPPRWSAVWSDGLKKWTANKVTSKITNDTVRGIFTEVDGRLINYMTGEVFEPTGFIEVHQSGNKLVEKVDEIECDGA